MLRILLEAAGEEWTGLLARKRDLLVLIGGPILYLVLFGFLYWQNVVNHIDTVIWDQDNTSLSRMVTDSFRDTDRFNIIGNVASQEELREALDTGKARAGIVIPRDFMKDVKKQHTSEILVCIDGTNMIISNAVVSSALEVVQTLSAGVSIKTIEGSGVLPEKAQKTVLPISFRPRIWYNPTFSYSNFLLFGLLGTAIQQILLLFTSITLTREKNNRHLAHMNLAETGAYILGKSLPYVVINYANLNFILALLIFGFGLTFKGSVLLTLLLGAVFVTALVALGVFLSIVCKNELEATQTSMLIAVPSFLVSGFTWPLQAMPLPVMILARILPLTYFVNALRDIALKGVGLEVIGSSILYLAGLIVVFYPLSVVTFKRSLSKNIGAPLAGETYTG